MRLRGAALTAVAVVLAATGAAGCFDAFFGTAPPTEADDVACANMQDDDGDGLVDCDDTDCAPSCGGCQPAFCVPGFARCIAGNGLVQQCDPSGTLFCPVGMCDATQSCVNGTCVAQLCDGVSLCTAAGQVQQCLAGTWVTTECPGGTICDPAAGSSCMPVTCTPGQLWCSSDTTVSGCTAFGVDTGVVSECGPSETCSAGVCSGPCTVPGACEMLFIGIDRTDSMADSQAHRVDIVNGGDAIAGVEVDVLFDGIWSTVVSTVVAPGSTIPLSVPNRHVEGTAVVPSYAYRLVSDAPVSATVVTLEPGGSAEKAALAPWPTALLGSSYVVVTLPHEEAMDWAGMLLQHPGGFAVIGAYDGTTVMASVTAATAAAPGIPAMGAGDVYVTTLNRGDILQLESASTGEDLTGSVVTASAPVAVMAFHDCVGLDAPMCDPMAEAMPPVERWATDYAVPVPASHDTIVRLLAPPNGAVLADVAATDLVTDVSGPLFFGGGDAFGEVVVHGASDPGSVRVTGGPMESSFLVAAIHGPHAALVVVPPPNAWHSAVFRGVAGGHLLLERLPGGPIAMDGVVGALSWLSAAGAEVATEPLGAGGAHRLEAMSAGDAFGGWLWHDDWPGGLAAPLGNGW
jgi:hypothetical protein